MFADSKFYRLHPTNDWQAWYHPLDRHELNANFVMCDGSVRSLEPVNSLTKLQWTP